MNSNTSRRTIEAIRTLFRRYGLPTQLVSDNGSQFTSCEFVHFLRANEVKHIRTAPYHLSSNGQAESFVQTMKRSLKASKNNDRSLSHRLANSFLPIALHLMLPLTLLRVNCLGNVHSEQCGTFSELLRRDLWSVNKQYRNNIMTVVQSCDVCSQGHRQRSGITTVI